MGRYFAGHAAGRCREPLHRPDRSGAPGVAESLGGLFTDQLCCARAGTTIAATRPRTIQPKRFAWRIRASGSDSTLLKRVAVKPELAGTRIAAVAPTSAPVCGRGPVRGGSSISRSCRLAQQFERIWKHGRLRIPRCDEDFTTRTGVGLDSLAQFTETERYT
jgi:hypothetical protein